MSPRSSWSRRGPRQLRLEKKTTAFRKSRAANEMRLCLEALEDRTLLSVAQWTFNEGSGTTAYDSVGDNDGTLVNGPVWTTGIIDGALSFDGIDDFVSVPDSPSLDLATALTTEAWVNFDSVDNRYETILSKFGDNGAQSYALRRFRTGDLAESWMGKIASDITTQQGMSSQLCSSFVPTSGQWYHVVATFDGTVHRLYINGQLDAEASISGTLVATSYPLWIGRSGYPGFAEPLAGDVDQITVHSNVLAPEEVWQRYHEHINAAPVAYDQAVLIGQATDRNIVLTGTDADNDLLRYRIVEGPSFGALTELSAGVYVYTPAAGFYGPDTFTYKANDGRDDSNVATVSITVTVDGVISRWEFNEGGGTSFMTLRESTTGLSSTVQPGRPE